MLWTPCVLNNKHTVRCGFGWFKDNVEKHDTKIVLATTPGLNRYTDYYDWDGDWGWFTENIDEDKEQFYNLQIPLTTDNW